MVDTQPGNALYQDYAHFFTTEASLMCLIFLSDKRQKYRSSSFPPHQLRFDCCGSITLAPPNAIIEGGEIRSSSSSKLILVLLCVIIRLLYCYRLW